MSDALEFVTIEYVLMLRPTARAVCHLPSDLTAREVERMIRWLRMLPLEGESRDAQPAAPPPAESVTVLRPWRAQSVATADLSTAGASDPPAAECPVCGLTWEAVGCRPGSCRWTPRTMRGAAAAECKHETPEPAPAAAPAAASGPSLVKLPPAPPPCPEAIAGKLKNPVAVARGKKGAAVLATKLTSERRTEIARAAGKAGGNGRPRAPFAVTAEEQRQHRADRLAAEKTPAPPPAAPSATPSTQSVRWGPPEIMPVELTPGAGIDDDEVL